MFHRDAPENEKLVLITSVKGLGRAMNRDVARMLEQIKNMFKIRRRKIFLCFEY